ncbi:MAG: EF-hand domain-containing protein [Gammaproteobacteria bacterium]|nr:EF-hand domain-containing protein [Gammaproteobacteria bacterium]
MDRFDKNGDNKIDLHEWQAVRKAAQQEVRKQHAEMRLQADTHLIKAPKERPFILSNKNPQQLAWRYRLWAWLHLAMFLFSALLLLQRLA